MQDTRGWVKRIGASVQRGSTTLESEHLVTLGPIFALLEGLPGLGGPAGLVHALHDAAFRTTYSAIRVVTGAITTAADMVLARRDDVAPAAASARSTEGSYATRRRFRARSRVGTPR